MVCGAVHKSIKEMEEMGGRVRVLASAFPGNKTFVPCMNEGIRRRAPRDIIIFAKVTDNTSRRFRPLSVAVAVVIVVFAALKN